MRVLLHRMLAGTAALLAATAVATPARAAAPAITVLVPPTNVAAGFGATLGPIVLADRTRPVENAVMTFEVSAGLAGVTLSNPAGKDVLCTDDGKPKMTCRVGFTVDLGPDVTRGTLVEATLNATKDTLGETGTIKVTFSGDGIAPVSTSAAVTVGEAVDLSGGETPEVTAGIGDDFEARMHVSNKGAIAAHGAAVTFDSDYAFQPRAKFSNCLYDGNRLTACVFDQELAAGRTYGVDVPYRVPTDTRAPIRAISRAVWMTTDDYTDLTKFLTDHGLSRPGTPGTGGKLTLTEQPAVQAANKQTDPHKGDDNDQFVYVSVTGKQGADLVALGATLDAPAGRTVPLTVGVRNDGPAAVDRERNVHSHADPAAVVVVTPPAGTTVTRIPDGCQKTTWPDVPTKPGATQYFCRTAGLMLPHTRTSWTFGLKVTKAGAAGLVEVNPACQCNRFTADVDKSNNTAKIVIKATGSGGAGGGLPITGPPTAIAGGAGAGLVIAGVAGFWLARRRRPRFEA